ncbi:N-acetylmuramoyl-L-alanine amidase [Marivivens marinus]|uniref:N-acetylmuramoyl-L-alanine amidase n=1 Tax=Marivivens marinus TaxID=3110173 RepID=UPI003B84A12A
MVVIHYTAMADCAAAERALCSPEAEVSAHYLISPQGDVTQLVTEADRAWHAGAGAWGAVTDINSRSIGIELSNTGATPFAAPQMDALEDLLRGIMARWPVPAGRVIGHSDCAPGRKIDPGARFDWRRLARQGLAVLPEAVAVDAPPEDLATATDAALVRAGYTADVPAEVRLAAFRLRARPAAAGPCDLTDLALARDMATRFPVDVDRTSA